MGRTGIYHALMTEDWSDLTANQIAEVFDVGSEVIYKAIYDIKRRTGVEVQYVKAKKGLSERLIAGEWKGYTMPEIAAELGTSVESARATINRLNRQGHNIRYKPLPKFGRGK